jgi:outer membrane receptor protein involved in Fe transport
MSRIIFGVGGVLGALTVAAVAQPNEQPTTVTVTAPKPTGTVKGRVLAANGDPVPGAVITLGASTALSDGDGNFELANATAGKLQVAATGYAQREVDAAPGKNVVVQMTVEAKGEEIVVTGTRLPEKRLDAPVTLEVVTEKDLKTAAGMSYLSSLSRVKGVDFSDSGIGDQRISARGFATQFNSRMITMIDGRLAQLPGSGLPQGNLLPTGGLDMKAVEVVVGPASALYGANAHTGVINVVTKTPWDQSGASLQLRGGTHDLMSGAARVAGTIADDVGYKLNGEFLKARDFTPDRATHSWGGIYEGDIVPNFDIQSMKSDGTLYYKQGDWLASAGGGISDSTGFSVTNAGVNHLRDWRMDYETATVSSPHVYGQVTRTGSDAGKTYQLDRLAKTVGAMGSIPDAAGLDKLRDSMLLVDKSSMIDSELQLREEMAGVKATLGGSYRHYTPRSHGTYLDDATSPIVTDEVGSYLQLDTMLFDRLRLAGATRVDHHSIYGTQVSPKAAVQYEVAPEHNIRIGYNRAFKSPTILEDYLKITDMLLGNRNGYLIHDMAGNVIADIEPLKPEQVDSFELGYKGMVDEHTYIDAVAYQSYYHDFISPLTSVANPAMGTFATTKDGTPVGNGTATQGALLTYMNFGKANVRGVDAGIDYTPFHELALSASASAIQLVSFTNNNSLQKDLVLNAPAFKLRGSIQTEDIPVKNTFLRLDGRYHTAYAFESGYWSSSTLLGGKLPSRAVVDVTAGYRLPKQRITISGTVANLFDDQVPDVLGAPIPRRLMWLQLAYDFDGLRY